MVILDIRFNLNMGIVKKKNYLLLIIGLILLLINPVVSLVSHKTDTIAAFNKKLHVKITIVLATIFDYVYVSTRNFST